MQKNRFLLLLFVVFFCWVSILAIAKYIADSIDKITLQEEQEKLHFVIQLMEQSSLSTLHDYAEWDDMVDKGLLKPDADFLRQNLNATDLFRHFKVVEALLLDKQLKVRLCSNKLTAKTPTHHAAKHCLSTPLLPQIRHLIQNQMAQDNQPHIIYLPLNQQQIIQVAIAPLRYNPPRKTPPATFGYLIFIKLIDNNALQTIGQGIQLKQLHLTATPQAHSLPIKGPTGEPVAYISWSPKKPGHLFFNQAFVISTAGTGIMLLLLWGYHRKILKQQAQLKTLEEKLKQKTLFDPLTNCMKREILQQQLQQLIQKLPADGQVAFVLVDIANFTTLNNTMSFKEGDLVLRELGQRLQLVCEMRNCAIGRYGGDQFGILIYQWRNEAGLQDMLLQFIKRLQAPIEVLSGQCELDFYIAAVTYPQDGMTAEELFEKAEKTLKLAKQNQQINTPCFPDAALMKKMQRKQELAKALPQALKQDEFYLVFQPFISTRPGSEGQVIGAEVLLRWHSEQFGEVYPDEFIPVAESQNAIDQIEFWVLSKALALYPQLQQQFGEAFHLSINLSPVTLSGTALTTHLQQLKEKYQFPPTQIHLEITERLLTDASHTHVLNKLKQMGFHLSLDDFGTGYSALAYLTKMPLDTLKIDKSFVDKIIEGQPSDKHILHAIIEIAKALDMNIIAEGVEQWDQAYFLRTQQVDGLQGYLFARPQPLDAFLNLPTRFSCKEAQPTSPA